MAGREADVEIRTIDPEEFDVYFRAVAAGFHDEGTERRLEAVRRVYDPSRTYAAFAGGRIVATTTSLPLSLTVPGGEAPTGGVTAVTVHPTHRRRGILRRFMRLQLDALHERGDALAALWASEGAIYPRFGYGVATMNGRLAAIRARIAFREPEPAGDVRLLDGEAGIEPLAELYERVRPQRPGFMSRSRAWWEGRTLADDAEARQGAGPLFRAVLELDGKPEAYALYRFRHVWRDGVPEGELHVQEVVAASPRAHLEVWRFLFGVDLVATVLARKLPLDDPLMLLVSEPTALRLSAGDGLYLRLVDVERALELRGYAVDGRLVLEVRDDFCPWNAGVWALEASRGRASVERTSAAPDLRLAAGDLASLYLGGFGASELARALRVEELAPGALARADAMLRTERAPFCPESF